VVPCPGGADIQHVLLSPVSRGRTLRQPAFRGAVDDPRVGGGGAVAGLLASKRSPFGGVVVWRVALRRGC